MSKISSIYSVVAMYFIVCYCVYRVVHYTNSTSVSVFCQAAREWFLDHMATDEWWAIQILIKCPNQIVRQMFQRLCIHVVQKLRYVPPAGVLLNRS